MGWAVVSTILITLELFYSTKQIQRVAVSPHWTTKGINRAINKKGQIGEKNTRNDKDKIKKNKKQKNKQKNKTQTKYILSTLKH